MEALPRASFDQLFLQARSHNRWKDMPVPDDLLHRLYDVLKWGPTSSNCCPARFVFVRSPEAKEKLVAAVFPGNVDKTRSAPVVAIIAHDLEFYEKLPKLAPHADVRKGFLGKEKLIQETAFRNGTLQGAYLMLAARALGLDCGPMSGFDNAKVDEAFFPGTAWRSNFICGLGVGDPDRLHPRAPRLDFDEACKIV